METFLPGPVPLTDRIRKCLAAPLVSHRGVEVADAVQSVRSGIESLTGARHVAIFAGSGTLANDMIAAQLHYVKRPGVVVANGEFGERLIDHARRHALAHSTLILPWGEPITAARLNHALQDVQRPGWLWAVHCETSTGMLNDLTTLQAVSRKHNLSLVLDAISSVGTVNVDLGGVWLASLTSGKGLGAAPGVALVTTSSVVAPRATTPRYLDLGLFLSGDGVPFTIPSTLLRALAEALGSTNWPARIGAARAASARFRSLLAGDDVQVLAGSDPAPGVVVVPVPAPLRAIDVARRVERAGYAIAWRSDYLRSRNWMQVAFMGAFSDASVEGVAAALVAAVKGDPSPAVATADA